MNPFGRPQALIEVPHPSMAPDIKPKFLTMATICDPYWRPDLLSADKINFISAVNPLFYNSKSIFKINHLKFVFVI